MKLGIINLGCPKNTVDTEVMLSCLKGMAITTNPKEADVILINTCAFLKSARKESSDAIRDMIKYGKKGVKIIVAGCFVTKDLNGLKKAFPGVFAWLGVNDMMNIGEAVRLGGDFTSEKPFVYKGKNHTAMLNPYSAYVKISEGCNHKCSFCIIPQIKGRYRSRKIADIAAEVARLVSSGIKEINLISQDLTYYGRDLYAKPVLDRLLKAILKKTRGYFWLRLLYLYPDFKVLKSIMPVIKNDSRVLRYFDIPFQHVNDRILKSMKRGYGKNEIMKTIDLIRTNLPGATIRTSFITGYPGEGKNEFAELLEFIRHGHVDRPGVFGYSDEPDSGAYGLTAKVKSKIIKQREKALTSAAAKVYYNISAKEQGQKKEALITAKAGKNAYLARTAGNAPDIDGYVSIESKTRLKPGQFCVVRI